ncbi:5'-nucleotidase [Hortaea werneckii]|nr:5'-nucleotidase [Hortaea werneckii]KAI6882753.1 5'-nucleotidase [Hortaea werneckii]KAI6991579.1 5'-nucleotidase [Hortaea werneckii]KAI7144920.1 5'-nucleotidase [Hortaea werneckii]KAI7170327.1 5'-nucleotidase [Hortaea werneckii]
MALHNELLPGESITHSTVDNSGPPHVRLLHYNDVYHVEAGSRDPVGGIPRFKTLCDYYQNDARFVNQPQLLTLFSGDAFNPSLESSVTKGKHMVPMLNLVKTDVACLGNHDLDFGVEQFRYLAGLCKFPWLCANVLDPALGEDAPLGNYVAKQLAPQLRAEGADMVIALTHQRQPNDEKLARDLTPGTIDLILSGHDHFYAHAVVNETHVLRSGTDFKQLSYLECWRKDDGKWDFHIIRRDVLSSIPQDAEAVEMVEKITSGLKPKLESPIGYTAAPLDARFLTVRTKESNLGNFVCDIMRFSYDADCCIMASGTIRGDQVYPPGMLKVKDIMNCFPFEDPCVVVGVNGKAIHDALENAVSKYPALEGRFPQVSGITLAFDPSLDPGKRCTEVKICGQPLDYEREYRVATREYMVRGKDGFTSLMIEEHGGQAKSIVGDESGMLISSLLRQYFMSLKVLGRWKNWSSHMGQHWRSVHDGVHSAHPVRDPVKPGNTIGHANLQRSKDDSTTMPSLVGKALQKPSSTPPKLSATADEPSFNHSESEDDDSPRADIPAVGAFHSKQERELIVMRKVMRKWWRIAGLKGHPSMCEEAGDDFGVHWTKGISPRLEGRIRMATSA